MHAHFQGDEFTTPGVYCASDLTGSLYDFAIATKMGPFPQPTSMPYVRFVLVVESTGPAKKASDALTFL